MSTIDIIEITRLALMSYSISSWHANRQRLSGPSPHANDPIDIQLRRLWEQEEVPASKTSSEADEICEKLYRKIKTRQENG